MSSVNGGSLSSGGVNIGWVGTPVSIEVIAGPSRERENAKPFEGHDSNQVLEGIFSRPIDPNSNITQTLVMGG